MALEATSRDEIQEIAEKLQKFSVQIRQMSESMKAAGVKKVLIHKRRFLNTELPSIENWVMSTELDVRKQILSFEKGVQSAAEANKKRADTLKKKKRDE